MGQIRYRAWILYQQQKYLIWYYSSLSVNIGGGKLQPIRPVATDFQGRSCLAISLASAAPVANRPSTHSLLLWVLYTAHVITNIPSHQAQSRYFIITTPLESALRLLVLLLSVDVIVRGEEGLLCYTSFRQGSFLYIQ